MIYSNRLFHHQQHDNLTLLPNKEAKMSHLNDKLLLPSSTRSLKRRLTILEKSRDWARRLITLHRPRRNTISNDKTRDVYDESNRYSSRKSPKNFDEDGYLSPLEINAKIDNINHHHQSHSKLLPNTEQLQLNSNLSQLIYRYHDPNIQTKLCQEEKRLPNTCEYQKSLSIVDYIDLDYPDEHDDDPLDGLKYLFNDHSKQQQQQGNFSRRIPRRPTNASSISTDSGYSDMPIASTKLVPVHLISCTLIPVNLATHCSTCTCHSSSSSTTCLSNSQERKISRSYILRQPLPYVNKTENKNQCTCTDKYDLRTIKCPSAMSIRSLTKTVDNNKQEYYCQQQRCWENKQASLKRFQTITEDLTSISRWYKPYLEREAVCDALQQADYGTFILRNSTTHPDCYALSIKVPKFSHDSNIVHYLIEKTIANNTPSYRIKGTIKQFPTLVSLLTHHSVMPEILPITLNLNESFTI